MATQRNITDALVLDLESIAGVVVGLEPADVSEIVPPAFYLWPSAGRFGGESDGPDSFGARDGEAEITFQCALYVRHATDPFRQALDVLDAARNAIESPSSNLMTLVTVDVIHATVGNWDVTYHTGDDVGLMWARFLLSPVIRYAYGRGSL